MSKANRVRVAWVKEVTPGTTPTTPRMRTFAMVSEALVGAPAFSRDEEINSDRMNSDPVVQFRDNTGRVSMQLRYPIDDSPLSDFICSALYGAWVKTPQRDNDGVADSIIQGIVAATQVVTVTTGAAFVASQLVKFSGFTNAANNAVVKCTTGSATVPAFVGGPLVDEAAPPGTARMKVVGFQGASGDITATASGLASTALDFTTLGLANGMFLKIGGTAAGDKFANVSANNDWVRVTAIAAAALTLDHLPSGWGVDNGSGKTIKVWFGDYILNGTTLLTGTIERGFLGQAVPSYCAHTGMGVTRMVLNATSRRRVSLDFDFLGMQYTWGTVALDASPDAVITPKILVANVNIGRVTEAGSRIAGPNYLQALEHTIDNQVQPIDELDSAFVVDRSEGEFMSQTRLQLYFGDLTLKTKLENGTATNMMWRFQRDSQAVYCHVPRAVPTGEGNPNATGKNTQVMLPILLESTRDTTAFATTAAFEIGRLEYYE